MVYSLHQTKVPFVLRSRSYQEYSLLEIMTLLSRHSTTVRILNLFVCPLHLSQDGYPSSCFFVIIQLFVIVPKRWLLSSVHTHRGGLAPHSYGPKLGDGTEKGRPQLPQLLSNSWLKPLVKGYIGRAGSSVNTLTRKRSLIIHERKSNQIPL